MSDYERRERTPEAYTDETIAMPRGKPQQSPRPQNAPPRRNLPVRRPRARRRAWPVIRNSVIGLFVLVLVLLAVGYWQLHSVASAVVLRDVRPATLNLGGGTNVLIIGTDERVGFPAEGVRGDTLIVVHYDTFGRWASLLSIPRDSQVDLRDVGETKINVAYGQGYARAEELYGVGTTPQQGGMALAAQTVEQLLKLDQRSQHIDQIATINFDGFARIIDALGGVTIDVPRAIHDDEYPTPDFGVMTIDFQPGVQQMNGERALIYARTRHDSSDFDRGVRQQQVMRAIVDAAKAKGPVGVLIAMPKLRAGLQGAVATTLPFDRPDQLLSLLWLASGLNPDQIAQARLSPEIDPSYQEIGSNLLWSEAGIGAAVDALLAQPAATGVSEEKAIVQVLNGTTAGGLANKISFALEDNGFTLISPDNAPTNDVAKTTVYDLTGKPRTARSIAQQLGARYQQGAPDGITSQADIVVVLGKDAAN